jgi:hypothetical protein
MAKKKTQQPVAPVRPASAARPSAPVAPVVERQPTHFFEPGFWRAHWLPVLLLVAASFGLYSASIKYGYVLDDEMVIWKNAYVQEGVSGIGKIFKYDSFMGYFQKKEDLQRLEGGRYRPLSLATFAAEISLLGNPAPTDEQKKAAKLPEQMAKITRGEPWLSHTINILLYGLTGALLFRILLGFFPLSANKRWWFSAAFAGGLLFVFHPLHTESVANIKGRDEILALMCSLGALWAMMKYFDTQKKAWQWTSGVIFLLGLFSKENTLTFLAVIPLSVWFFGRVSFGRALSAAWPLLAATFLFLIFRQKALGFWLDHGKAVNDLMNDSFLGMSFGEKLATIFLTLGWYIKLLFAPWPLTHDYYPYHVPKVNWLDWRALLSLALYAGMAVWAYFNLRKRNLPAYTFVFFIATISIVSNLFVSVGSFMNERFAFMPSVAFCMLAGWFLMEQLPKWLKIDGNQVNWIGALGIMGVLGVYAMLTVKRVPDWQSAFTLNASAVVNSPGSARAQSFYATAVYQELYINAKTKEEKLRWVDTMDYHIQRAIEIYPDYGSAWVMKVNAATARFEQDHQMDRLFNTWTACLQKQPYNPMLRGNIEQYVRYLATNGGNPMKVNAFCYRIGYEEFFQKRRDTKSSAVFLEMGLLNNAADERHLNALAEVYQAAGQAGKAEDMRRRAAMIAADPNAFGR